MGIFSHHLNRIEQPGNRYGWFGATEGLELIQPKEQDYESITQKPVYAKITINKISDLKTLAEVFKQHIESPYMRYSLKSTTFPPLLLEQQVLEFFRRLLNFTYKYPQSAPNEPVKLIINRFISALYACVYLLECHQEHLVKHYQSSIKSKGPITNILSPLECRFLSYILKGENNDLSRFILNKFKIKQANKTQIDLQDIFMGYYCPVVTACRDVQDKDKADMTFSSAYYRPLRYYCERIYGYAVMSSQGFLNEAFETPLTIYSQFKTKPLLQVRTTLSNQGAAIHDDSQINKHHRCKIKKQAIEVFGTHKSDLVEDGYVLMHNTQRRCGARASIASSSNGADRLHDSDEDPMLTLSNSINQIKRRETATAHRDIAILVGELLLNVAMALLVVPFAIHFVATGELIYRRKTKTEELLSELETDFRPRATA